MNLTKETERYVQYDNKREVNSLNTNVYNGYRAVVFPRHLYQGYAVPSPNYLSSRPRDTETRYIIDVERMQHPEHASRFGYGSSPP